MGKTGERGSDEVKAANGGISTIFSQVREGWELSILFAQQSSLRLLYPGQVYMTVS